jgi:thiol-disulfide isomerase/thioredoxin
MKYEILIFLLLSVFRLNAQDKDITIKIHLRGVYDSKISLLPLSGPNALKTNLEIPAIKNGEMATITLSKSQLPGQFVLRFDYKEKESSSPYPSEKRIFVNNQDLELSINPPFCNNADSALYQKGETENTLFAVFSRENAKRKEKLGLLQNFLMKYDDNHSIFYQSGIKEYEKRRISYNEWISQQITLYKTSFVSNTFRFQYVSPTEWKDSVADRTKSLIIHYFDGINFNDPLIVKTTELNEWMTRYVNIYGSLATTTALRDSLFPLAAKTAIEKARLGDPKVYGWMVDYFYNGFESNNMLAGMKALQPYLDDPNCLTKKKQQIEKRLAGMQSLVTGSQAPDFRIKDETGKEVNFSQYPTNCRYKLVLFWSASCDHCKELIKSLYPWYQLTNKKLVEVIALSLDDNETDVKLWGKVHPLLEGWIHSRPAGGINSKEANAYFILSTPVMVLVDTLTNKIVALPETVEQLSEAVNK